MSPSSPEIQKLHDEIKEIELRTYQEKLKQKKKKLLEEENEIKNGDVATFDEREAEKKEIYKIMLGAILAYTLLTLFMFSTFFIIHKLRSHGCHGSDYTDDADNANALDYDNGDDDNDKYENVVTVRILFFDN